MVTLTVALTVEQILDLVHRLPPDDRRKLLDVLLAERYDHVLAVTDLQREGETPLTDTEIQVEIDAVRAKRRQDRHGAVGR